MSKNFLFFALFTVMVTESQASSTVAPKLSQKCIEALEPALKELQMTLKDLSIKEKEKEFIEHNKKTEAWKTFVPACKADLKTWKYCLKCTCHFADGCTYLCDCGGPGA